MGWSDKGIERQVEPEKPKVEFWHDETGRWEAMARLRSAEECRGWHRDYEQRVRELWKRESRTWMSEAAAIGAICEIVADADEEIERMRTEIGVLKGRGVREGLEDVGVRGRLAWLRGKGIMGWLVEGDE